MSGIGRLRPPIFLALRLDKEVGWRYFAVAKKKRKSVPAMTASLVQIEGLLSPNQPVGIARLAAQGESIRQGHDVEYFTLPARGRC